MKDEIEIVLHGNYEYMCEINDKLVWVNEI